MINEHKTRAERIPPRRDGWEALRDDLNRCIESYADERVALATTRIGSGNSDLDREPLRCAEEILYRAIDRLLAAAPKPEPAEPAQDDENEDDLVEEFQCVFCGDSDDYDWSRVHWTRCPSHPARIAVGSLAREKADLRAKLAAAEETIRCGREIVNEAREILGFPNSVLLSSAVKDVKDRLAAAEARIVESDGLWGWIAENIGDVDFHVLVPAGIFSSQPWVATGSTLRRALEKARRELGAAMGGT